MRFDRFEIKFLVSKAQREKILDVACSRLAPDEFSGGGTTYPVVSLYYDSPERDCYWEKLQGVKSRRKLRVRCYGGNGGSIPPTFFIEVKHKFEGRGVKRRVGLPRDVALSIGRGEPVELPLPDHERRIIEECLGLVRHRRFQGVCVLRYDRQAFEGLEEDSDLRITFDQGVCFRMHNLDLRADDRRFEHFLIHRDQTIMEVKVTRAVPYWLMRLVSQAGCRPVGFSKYCSALHQGDPVLRCMTQGRPAMVDRSHAKAERVHPAIGNFLIAPV